MSDILTPPAGSDSSPYVIVPKVINASWNLGLDKISALSTKVSGISSTVFDIAPADIPTVSAGTVSVPTIAEPAVSIPTSVGSDWESVYDSKYLELVNLLSDKFVAFMTVQFPDDSAAYGAVEDWLQAAIANPNAGIPATVQAQIWSDDHARITADKIRAQEAVIAQFAGRRFPLPPDVAASAALQIEQKAQEELAGSSRKVAMLSLDMMKFTVEKLISLRQLAMQSAIDYIKALASGPDMASKLVGIGYDAQSKLISAASSFYNARSQAAETVSKVQQYNNSVALEAAVKNQTAELTMMEDKLKALLAECQTLASTCSSLFNNLHVQAGISGSGQTAVHYNYSNDTASSPASLTSA